MDWKDENHILKLDPNINIWVVESWRRSSEAYSIIVYICNQMYYVYVHEKKSEHLIQLLDESGDGTVIVKGSCCSTDLDPWFFCDFFLGCQGVFTLPWLHQLETDTQG